MRAGLSLLAVAAWSAGAAAARLRPGAVKQSTVFVDALADRGGDGSPSRPVRTLAEASARIREADGPVRVLLARGQTHRGTLKVGGVATAVGAFGPQELAPPVLSASAPIPVDAWAPGPRPDTFVANVTVPVSFAAEQGLGEALLVMDGDFLPLARSPNQGQWARARGFDASTGTLTYTGLGTDADLAGAGFRLRQTSYLYRSGLVASSSSVGDGSITLALPTTLAPRPAFGFFVDNITALADSHGEWTVRVLGPAPNPTALTAQVFLYWSNASAGPPSSHSFELGAHLHAVQAEGPDPQGPCSGFSLSGVQVEGAMGACVSVPNCTSVVVDSSRLLRCGGAALAANGSGTTVDGSTADSLMGGGFDVGDDATITGSTVSRVGLWAGYGHRFGNYVAVSCGARCRFEGNRVESIGYVGVRFAADSAVVGNLFTDVMLTLNDGGAVYTWNAQAPYPIGNITVTDNIVRGSPGNTESVPPFPLPGSQAPWGRGIYLDDRVFDVTIHNNTVSGASSEGIFLHGGFSYDVRDNVVFGCGISAMGMQDELDEPVRGARVTGNVFVTLGNASLDGGGPVCFQQTPSSNLTTMAWGDFTGNTYVAPWSASAVARRRIIEYRVPFHGALRQMGAKSWRSAGNGDPAAVVYPAEPRRRHRVTSTLSGNLVPFGGLNASSDAPEWQALCSTRADGAKVVFDPDAPPAIGPSSNFSSDYGVVSNLLRSQPFDLRTGQARVRATLLAQPRFRPNPTVVSLGVGICAAGPAGRAVGADGSVGRGDERPGQWCDGTMIGQEVAVEAGPYGAAEPPPATVVDFVVDTAPGPATLDILVPDYSARFWVAGVSVTYVTAEAEPLLETLVSNPSRLEGDVALPPGAVFTSLDGSGTFQGSILLGGMRSVVLVCKSGCS